MRARQLAIAVGPEHEEPHRLLGRHDVTQQLQARLVGPLQVVEHQHDRLLSRQLDQQADHSREQQEPLRVGIRCSRWREVRNPARQRGHQPDQLRPVRSDVRDELLFGRVHHVVADRFARRADTASRDLLRSARTTRTRPHRTPREQLSATNVVLPRPASPETISISRPSPATTRLNASAIAAVSVLAADHTHRGTHAQTARQRHRIRRVPAERLPAHRDRVDRIRQSLQLQRPDADALVLAAPTRHRPHDIRREDLPSLAPRAESSRLDHRIAEVVVVFGRDFATAQPDAQADGVFTGAVVAFDALLHPNRARQRRRRRGEHDHEPVAQVLHLGAARLRDRLAQDREMLAAQLVGRVGCQARRQRGRAHHVGEQHRHVLSRQRTTTPAGTPIP